LFAERAEAVQSDFMVSDDNAFVVAEICRRLDGLPLAIELAAARVKLLPPDELLARLRGSWLLSTDGLRDVSERQRTLRGAIGWSYDLLTPWEQTLFTRLGVFVGGCTLEAAEMMCEDVLSAAQVLDGIASLLDKSLLHRETGQYGEPRYAMLETVREYALERSALSGDDSALHTRHANCFLRIIENAEQADLDPSHARLLRRIDEDIANVRGALDWAMKHDAQAALGLTAVFLVWQRERGFLEEARRLIRLVFVLPAASTRTVARAKALLVAAFVLSSVNQIAEAQAYAEEGLAISQELGYRKGEADALVRLGRIAHIGLYDLNAAKSYLDSALAAYRRIEDPGGICYALVVSSELALLLGDNGHARMLAEECLVVAEQTGFPFPWPLATLATLALGEGDLDKARFLNEQRLAAERAIASKGSLVYTLSELGKVCTRQGELVLARAYLSEALELAKPMGEDWLSGCYVYLAALEQACGDYHGAVRCYRESLAMAGSYRWIWGPCLLGLGALAAAMGQAQLTAKLMGATESVDKSSYRLMPDERDDFNRLSTIARERLSSDRFNAAWNEGRTLTFEQAAEDAVSILEAALHILSPSQ
jgi:predicted ATPase